MASLRHVCRRLAFFLVPRYPFANCLTLLMLLAERADRESYVSVNIFVHISLKWVKYQVQMSDQISL